MIVDDDGLLFKKKKNTCLAKQRFEILCQSPPDSPRSTPEHTHLFYFLTNPSPQGNTVFDQQWATLDSQATAGCQKLLNKALNELFR